MFSCIARFHPMLKISVPTPARNIATTKGMTAGLSPRISIGRLMSETPIMPARRGYRKLTPSRMTVIASSPTDSADSA